MTYQVAERFKSIQGEGVWTGTPMAFLRFVGCSVGKKVCHHCDTDFERSYPWLDGGTYTPEELAAWAKPNEHVCLTGGEPLDQDLPSLMMAFDRTTFHIETSGTKAPGDLTGLSILGRIPPRFNRIWFTVSPKPGYLIEMIERADEVKVIVPGLGNGDGWPGPADALRWAKHGKVVFLQPRNGKFDLNMENLGRCERLVNEHPELRLSVQMHKVLRVR